MRTFPAVAVLWAMFFMAGGRCSALFIVSTADSGGTAQVQWGTPDAFGNIVVSEKDIEKFPGMLGNVFGRLSVDPQIWHDVGTVSLSATSILGSVAGVVLSDSLAAGVTEPVQWDSSHYDQATYSTAHYVLRFSLDVPYAYQFTLGGTNATATLVDDLISPTVSLNIPQGTTTSLPGESLPPRSSYYLTYDHGLSVRNTSPSTVPDYRTSDGSFSMNLTPLPEPAAVGVFVVVGMMVVGGRGRRPHRS